MAAYNELRDEAAMRKYGKKLEDLPEARQEEIRNEIPLVLSEAEATNFGEEKK